MDKHFTMWIKTHCPFCIKARDELFSQKVSHTIHIMDGKPEELDKIKEEWRFFTVPIVVVDEELIGGYTDLLTWFDEDKDD